jgi:hypothetical protein
MTVGQWAEHPFVDNGKPPQGEFCNYTSSVQTLSNVGYLISERPFSLDSLNYGSLPPPGTPGSPFTPLPSLDGTTLAGGDGIGGEGGCITVSAAVPEPSSIISLSTGLLVLMGYLARRRLAARLVRTAAGA